MITLEQQQWLDHLSDIDSVKIVPWDETSADKFSQIERQIKNLIDSQQLVLHRGASSLKISGQDEIDIYLPIKKQKYDQLVIRLSELYGPPKSNYDLKRARFVTLINNKHIDIFVINETDIGWTNSEIFYHYLLSNKKSLLEYQDLKENNSGKSSRQYYKSKIEFINNILLIAR